MAGGGEAAHVEADLRDDDLGREFADAGIELRSPTAARKGARSRLDLPVDPAIAASSASIWSRCRPSRKR